MRISAASWHCDGEFIQAIRRQVFMEEQGVPEELEMDGLDDNCFHVLAYAPHEIPVGTARMTKEGKIGRMAVLQEWRRQGAGGLMLRSLLALAVERGLNEVYLNAQIHAAPFYEKYDFIQEGLPFEEAGIPHIKMRRPLGEDIA